MAQYEGYETILIEQQERVLRLTMNRPEALNAFDAQMHEEMSRIFSEIHDDDGTDVVVLTGAGRAFSAGGDMTWLQEMIDDPSVWARTSVEGKRIVLSILEARQPWSRASTARRSASARRSPSLATWCSRPRGRDRRSARQRRPRRRRRRRRALARARRLRAGARVPLHRRAD